MKFHSFKYAITHQIAKVTRMEGFKRKKKMTIANAILEGHSIDCK